MKEWHDEAMHIFSSNVWQSIKYSINPDTKEDEAYVSYRGLKLWLSRFMQYGEGRACNLTGIQLDGFFATSAYSTFFVKISSNGEKAKVFYAHW